MGINANTVQDPSPLSLMNLNLHQSKKEVYLYSFRYCMYNIGISGLEKLQHFLGFFLLESCFHVISV
jgi:hypothetical protein